jgi:2-furoyl-CoA dehydrogenase large subunit
MEVPAITIVDHCTPSPLTEFCQKGSGEAGYLGSPAAIASAINDALAPAGASIDALPMTPQAIWRALRPPQRARPGCRAQRPSTSPCLNPFDKETFTCILK